MSEYEGEESLQDILPFLDVEAGLTYAADDEDLYIEILQSYAYESEEEKIQQFFQEEAWTDYATLMHAVKSTSLTIGATELSAGAKEMELAAKAGDYATVKAKHQQVMNQYLELLQKLRDIVEEPED